MTGLEVAIAAVVVVFVLVHVAVFAWCRAAANGDRELQRALNAANAEPRDRERLP